MARLPCAVRAATVRRCTGEMPPAGMPCPAAPAPKAFTKSLEDALDRAAAANPNPGGPGEQTPLLVAAKANRPEAMRALVAGGADPKLKAQDGTTLLMAAAGSGHVEAVKYAYELDPDVKAVNATNATVMHASVAGTMQNSTQAEICKVIQFLADKGAALDEKDGRSRTPIDVADGLPIDKAVDLLTDLIKKSGATPKTPSKR